jgi:hypothetical protein
MLPAGIVPLMQPNGWLDQDVHHSNKLAAILAQTDSLASPPEVWVNGDPIHVMYPTDSRKPNLAFVSFSTSSL